MGIESQTSPRAVLSSTRPDQVEQRPGQLPMPGQARAVTSSADPGVRVWLGHDPVTQLREWGTERVHLLPGPEVAEWVVGSDPSAALCLVDPSCLVSRRHARLVRDGSWWQIEDLHSKNGLRQDRERNARFPVAPGVEIGIGSLSLIAENQALVQLRRYLARVLGGDATGWSAIEVAIQAIRAAANQRRPLVIGGADDMVAVARQLHRRTIAPGAPFVVCGIGPHESDLSVNITATHADPATAFELALGGTVCVRAEKLPVRLERLMEIAGDRLARTHTQLIICVNKPPRWWKASQSIVVPRLGRRSASDLQDIIADYAIDAICELDAAPTSFSAAEREWVARRAARSFAQIEVTTLRIVAYNDAGNVHLAAARLGLPHVALDKWLRRRGLAR
jgi:pSer/pThr/pTyr-binding forkhead associated (FHA) protein